MSRSSLPRLLPAVRHAVPVPFHCLFTSFVDPHCGHPSCERILGAESTSTRRCHTPRNPSLYRLNRSSPTAVFRRLSTRRIGLLDMDTPRRQASGMPRFALFAQHPLQSRHPPYPISSIICPSHRLAPLSSHLLVPDSRHYTPLIGMCQSTRHGQKTWFQAGYQVWTGWLPVLLASRMDTGLAPCRAVPSTVLVGLNWDFASSTRQSRALPPLLHQAQRILPLRAHRFHAGVTGVLRCLSDRTYHGPLGIDLSPMGRCAGRKRAHIPAQHLLGSLPLSLQPFVSDSRH